MSADDDAATVDALCRRVMALRGDVADLLADGVRHLAPLSSPDEQRRLADAARARLAGLGDLEPLLADPSVDEVLVNAGHDIWVERHGELVPAGRLVGQPLEHLVERILAPIGRRADRTSPIVDARLPDGSRVCAVLPPIAVDGPTLSIRRFASRLRPLEQFTDGVGVRSCHDVVERRCNVLVVGATSSGKTSLLASLVATLADDVRIVVIEDTAELPVGARHVVRLEARPASVDGPPPIDLTDLVRTALRLRPDRLVVGEIRGDEVVGMMQAMNTGHDGSFATCHANGPDDALLRLESLVLRAAPAWPLAAIRRQLARSIDVVVHVARDAHHGGRRIASIDEVVDDGREGAGPVALRRLARLSPDGTLEQVGALTRGRRP